MTRIKAMQTGALAAGASFLLATLTVWAIMQGQAPSTDKHPLAQTLPTTAPTSLPATTEPNLRITNDVRVYQKVKDAVVNITSSRIVVARVNNGTFGGQIRAVPTQSLGSGFVIHPSGYIVTNEHVIDEGTDVQCVFSNGEKLAAKIIATDHEHDLAVLKVDPPHSLHAIDLGESEDLMIGEPVYAIGNPFGFAGTMTRGIVSALDRTLDISKDKSYKGLIQTDASINPGNSGGPLLNAYGQVVGINTAIREGAEGIGFAIAVSNMRDLLPAFLNPEALNRAQIGFSVAEHRSSSPPAHVAAAVVVDKVQPGSAADKAGLKSGDQLTAIDKISITNVVDALVALAHTRDGDFLDLGIVRNLNSRPDGEKSDIKVAVTKAPLLPVEDLLLTKMGIHAQNVTPALVAKFSLLIDGGIYIDSVQPNSPAAIAQLQPGDVLYQLGIYRVSSIDEAAALLKTVKEPVDTIVGIVRGNTKGIGVISLK